MGELMILEFSIFVMVAVGLLVRRIGIIGEQGEKNITDLVLMVVLPCNIFNSFLTRLSAELLSDCLWVLFNSLAIQISAIFYAKLFFRRESDARRRNLSYGMICSNAGFLGNPMAEGVFGSTGLMLASIYLIPQRIMMWSEGLAIYSGNSDKLAAFRRVVKHPCVIACFLGIAAMLTGINVPAVILTPIQTIGRCNTALSMMAVGMILARIDFHRLVDRTVALFTLHRLVLFPLAIYGVCLLLPVSPLVRGLSVLLAAMPAGVTTSMLAAKYDQDPEFATKLVASPPSVPSRPWRPGACC